MDLLEAGSGRPADRSASPQPPNEFHRCLLIAKTPGVGLAGVTQHCCGSSLARDVRCLHRPWAGAEALVCRSTENTACLCDCSGAQDYSHVRHIRTHLIEKLGLTPVGGVSPNGVADSSGPPVCRACSWWRSVAIWVQAGAGEGCDAGAGGWSTRRRGKRRPLKCSCGI